MRLFLFTGMDNIAENRLITYRKVEELFREDRMHFAMWERTGVGRELEEAFGGGLLNSRQ